MFTGDLQIVEKLGPLSVVGPNDQLVMTLLFSWSSVRCFYIG
jgi:hypothetical protein